MAIQESSAAQQQWLQQRLSKKAQTGPTSQIPTQPRTKPLPLSFAQQRLWFLAQLEPESTAYFMSSAIRLSGRLHMNALKSSLQFLVQRHEALRTTFVVENDIPFQMITTHVPVSLSFRDLQTLDSGPQSEEMSCIIEESRHQPFDLEKGPLFRFTIIRLSEEEHVFLFNLHHIISDGWSMAVFFRELTLTYTAYKDEQNPVLPNLPIQYADYAVWQRQYLEGKQLQKQLEFWKKELHEPLPTLSLATDFLRPPKQVFHGERINFTLSKSLIDRLKQVCQQNSSTLFMALLTVFHLLLHRLTGQNDLCVGIPSAGRTRQEIEQVMGFFINTLVVRTHYVDTSTFAEFLGKVRDTCLDAYTHQDVPFEKLVEALHPKRDLSRTPFFQVFFNMMPGESTPFSLPNLTATPLQKSTIDSKFDLTVYLHEKNQELGGAVVYNTTLFRSERIKFMIEQFEHLLHQIVASPDIPLHRHSLVTQNSQALLPDPTSPLASPTYESVPSQILEWAERTPDQIAIHQENNTISYRDLKEKGEACAHALQRLGVQPGEVIAIRGSRSVGFITSMVGTWLAGGIILPLDLQLPLPRQKFMLEKSKAACLVEVTTSIPESNMTQASIPCLQIDPFTGHCLSSNQEEDKAEPTLPSLKAEGPAYVFFTSGTTGIPKGILGSHQALSHFLTWQRETFCITSNDRFALFTGVSFDVMLRELFLPLSSGATAYLPPEDANTPERLQWLASEQITVIHLVPSITSFWLTSLTSPIPLSSLKWIFFAGEPLTSQLVELWETNCPGTAQFVNLYGPTETTLAKCWYLLPTPKNSGIQPIGRPISQTQLLVVGPQHSLCGIGEVGELVIRTPFRTFGYLDTLEGMSQPFVSNPYRKDPSDLIYHTGDLGRYRWDGMIEILGRSDDQVKIRGVRVEPQEVAMMLSTCPGVQRCTVLANQDDSNEWALTAYVIGKPNTFLSNAAMRSFLDGRMPSAFVPSQYVQLEEFPLTPNGKIDRQALSRLTPAKISTESYVAPRTKNETQMTGIWESVLGHNPIGIHDNFFDLGGHSLLATQIISRIRETFKTTIPLRTLFEAPTVSGITEKLTQTDYPNTADSLPPIKPLPSGAPFPLSYSQERMWFLYQFAPTSAAYNIPWAFDFHGTISIEALEQAVNEILQRHAVLRTVFPEVDGYPVPQIQPFSPISVPIKDFQEFSDDIRDFEVQQFAKAEARRPFNMAEGPLLRVTFVRLQINHVIVLLTLHHIIADGWSAGIVRRELDALYSAFQTGLPSPLNELPIQYQDFAAWQRGWLKDHVLDNQLSYWTSRLAGAPMILDLPLDRPRGSVQTFAGGRHIVELPRSLTMGLSALTHREGVTLFMALLSALSIQLERYTSNEDLLIGVPIANRHFLEIENLIGTFVNTLVLRTQLTDNPSFLDLLHQVRQTTLEAYAHQDLPFEVLVDAMRPPRDLSRSPVFQVMLSVLNFNQARSTERKNVGKIVVDRQAAQFDLTLAVSERPNATHITAWSYNSDLFELATIQRMSKHFQRLLEDIVAHPQKRIQDLNLLPELERKQIVAEWNNTSQPNVNVNQCLPNLLENQASQHPDSIAVVFEGQSVTYAVLNQRANQVARHLQKLGVGPEVRVAIFCERSLNMILALWGTVKAGGAYVPIDPYYPQDRIAMMLEDAGVAVIVAQKDGPTAPSTYSGPIMWIDSDWPIISQEPTSIPNMAITPQNLAYMIFTSGSTGRPKGVQIPHGCFMNFLEAMAGTLGVTPYDRLLAVTSLSFDIAGLELWGPVLAGGQVILAGRETTEDGSQLLACLERESVTIMQATPATWQLLLVNGWTGQRGLRLLCGGEQISLDLAYELLDRCQNLWNLYGPTETTVWSTWYPLAKDHTRISIGHPIANTQVYVTDRWGHLAPIGVPGELFIGGEGVARGYWQRPDITAERFVPNPFSAKPGERLYKTGDLVRTHSDGRLEWLSRLDHQIKLRGYRIELGEIETVLRQHPTIHKAVVVIREDRKEDCRLVAYIQMVSGHSFDSAKIREIVTVHLPAYMVPAIFINMESFPVTPNGKIDRKALPIPSDSRPDLAQEFSPPANPTEQVIAEIWSEVLGVKQVGREDNFFELGGHSLLATQVIARIRSRTENALPLRTFFEYPTVAGLASQIQDDFNAKTGHLENLLDDLDSMSEEEAQALLEQESQKSSNEE